MQGQAELLQIVHALGSDVPPHGPPARREEQGDQDGDDRDHHQQLDQRESAGRARDGLSSRREEFILGLDPRSDGRRGINKTRSAVTGTARP